MGWISIRHGIGVVKRVYIRVPWGRMLIGPWTHWRTIVGWGRQWTTTLRGHGRRGRNSCQRLSYDFVIVSPRGALDHRSVMLIKITCLSLISSSTGFYLFFIQEFTSRTQLLPSRLLKHAVLVCIIFYLQFFPRLGTLLHIEIRL